LIRSSRADGWALPDKLEGRPLLVVRVAWLSLAAGLTVLSVGAFVLGFVDPTPVTTTAPFDLLSAAGMNLRLMVGLIVVVPVAVVIVLSGVVFWRRSDDPMALLFMMTLLAFMTWASRGLLFYEGIPVFSQAVNVVYAIFVVGMSVVWGLFPNGRLVPRSIGWLVVAAVLLILAFPDSGRVMLVVLAEGTGGVSGRGQALVVGWIATAVVGLLAQSWRYRHVSDRIERQQTRWVVVPGGLLFAGAAVTFVLRLSGALDGWAVWILVLLQPFLAIFPVMVANAVLRYRLYELDRIISRTASYAVLTAILGAIYATAVIGFGFIARAVTGDGGGELVVAASTLAVAAAFRPLRRRVQETVDRRFNRAQFDATRTLEDFGQRLRDEVDLDTLRDELVDASRSSLAPACAWVWLTPIPVVSSTATDVDTRMTASHGGMSVRNVRR
jgi:hypothetical protein